MRCEGAGRASLTAVEDASTGAEFEGKNFRTRNEI